MAIVKISKLVSDVDGNVPFVSDWNTVIPGLSGLLTWNPFDVDRVVLDDDDKAVTCHSGYTSGFTFTQATASSRPVWAADQINGRGALTFDKTVPQWMNFDGDLPTSGDFTKVMIVKSTDSGSGSRSLWGNGASNASNLYYNYNSIVHAVDSGADKAQASATSAGTDWIFLVASFDASAGTAKISLNGGAVTSTAVANAANGVTTQYLGTGSASNPSGSPMEGSIALAMLFDTDLHASAQETVYGEVKDYARQVYGLSAIA